MEYHLLKTKKIKYTGNRSLHCSIGICGCIPVHNNVSSGPVHGILHSGVLEESSIVIIPDILLIYLQLLTIIAILQSKCGFQTIHL